MALTQVVADVLFHKRDLREQARIWAPYTTLTKEYQLALTHAPGAYPLMLTDHYNINEYLRALIRARREAAFEWIT